MLVSFQSILTRLVARGRQNVELSPPTTTASPPTSIRLKPSTRLFIEKQAETLSTSQQSVINMILDGVAETTMEPVSSSLRMITDRFFHLFDAHKLDLPNIVSVMAPAGFKLSDLNNGNRILDLLDRKALNYVAETFFVRREWLSGSSDYPISNEGIDVRWYKNVHAIAWRVLRYHKLGLDPQVMFIRRRGANFERARIEEDKVESEAIGVVVKLHRQTADGLSYSTYESWEFGRWNYWRCREQLKHLIAFCDEAAGFDLLRVSGFELEAENVSALSQGRILPVTALARRGTHGWFPDDYASIRGDVKFEATDWQSERKGYENGGFSHAIQEYLKKRDLPDYATL